jgi:hypothetical protein
MMRRKLASFASVSSAEWAFGIHIECQRLELWPIINEGGGPVVVSWSSVVPS